MGRTLSNTMMNLQMSSVVEEALFQVTANDSILKEVYVNSITYCFTRESFQKICSLELSFSILIQSV